MVEMSAFASAASSESLLLASVLWVESLLLGSVGTSLAITAVAAIGFATLAGRLSVRRGATVILGCFILFGAPALSIALMGLAHSNGGVIQSARIDPPAPAKFEGPAKLSSMDDPYAGASVPMR